jgi:hypothetical protein
MSLIYCFCESLHSKKCWLQLGAYRTEALWICKQLTTTRKVSLLLPAERNVKYGFRIIGMLGHSAVYMLFSIQPVRGRQHA